MNHIYYAGTLDAPLGFRIDVNYTSRIVLSQWTAPFSLTISNSSGALQYVLCTNISGQECKNLTVLCQTRQLCMAALNDSRATLNMIEMSTSAIQFSVYAINGAGDGKTATFVFTRGNSISYAYLVMIRHHSNVQLKLVKHIFLVQSAPFPLISFLYCTKDRCLFRCNHILCKCVLIVIWLYFL